MSNYKKSVCVDFDAVIATYDKWRGEDHFGEPRPGIAEFLEELSKIARVVIFTTRCKADMFGRPDGTTPEQLMLKVKDYLDRNNLFYDEIYIGQGKPIAAAYLDGRAVGIKTNPSKENLFDSLEMIKELL